MSAVCFLRKEYYLNILWCMYVCFPISVHIINRQTNFMYLGFDRLLAFVRFDRI